MRVLAPATVALCVAASLAGCSGDPPAVCQSLDGLEDSIAQVRDIDLSSDDDLSQLTAGLEDVRSDWEQVRSDAGSEFADQIDAVTSSYDSLRSTVEAVQADPSGTTVAEAAAAVSAFSAAVETFVEDVNLTC